MYDCSFCDKQVPVTERFNTFHMICCDEVNRRKDNELCYKCGEPGIEARSTKEAWYCAIHDKNSPFYGFENLFKE